MGDVVTVVAVRLGWQSHAATVAKGIVSCECGRRQASLRLFTVKGTVRLYKWIKQDA